MIKGVHAFPKGISPKVNIKVQLEFELAYYDVLMTRTYNATRTEKVKAYKWPYIFKYKQNFEVVNFK